MKEAAAGILICGDLEKAFALAKEYWVIDGAIAGQNILLAARALGIGSVTHEIVHSLRGPKFSQSITPMNMAAVQTTVRGFLSERAVYAKSDYYFYADGVEGVNWDNVYCSAVPNVRKIHVPLLCMGMTGGYEFLASEVIYDNAASEDKYIAFVEGAAHNFDPERGVEKYPGQFGDTEKLVFDFVDGWLSAEGRF